MFQDFEDNPEPSYEVDVEGDEIEGEDSSDDDDDDDETQLS
jgi:hypothetical protein